VGVIKRRWLLNARYLWHYYDFRTFFAGETASVSLNRASISRTKPVDRIINQFSGIPEISLSEH